MRLTIFSKTRRALLLLLPLPGLLSAQLVLSGPIPKGPNPPVVFLNGYQTGCSGTDFASNFGGADKLMQASSIVTLYFDNCSVGSVFSRPTLEALGTAFGSFLAGLKYTDGTAVTQVDAVAHSMGGLILRSYLAGKQDTAATSFSPPATPLIRRAIFLATPHFGTTIAGVLGVDVQTREMTPGSQFLFDLNGWNQGTDDLRGIQAIAISGNGGTGQESSIQGFDDGIVTLTSSSLGFYRPGTTRILPDCHTLNSLLTLFGYCASSTPALNQITNDTSNPVSQILVSYLTGTTAWQSIGQAAEANSILSTTGGIELQLRDQNDAAVAISGATTPDGNGGTTKLQINSNATAYSEALRAGPAVTQSIQITPATAGTVQTVMASLTATTEVATVVKPGPLISPKGVIPAAGPAPFPYDVAPGAYVSIYGTNLASAAMSATQPYPAQLADVQVLVNGTPQPVQYISAGQINFIYASVSPGLTQLTVKNANGQNTVNVRVAPAVPSIFLLDANATAAAVNALTGVVVGVGTPFHAGDVMALFLTGLGATTSMNGLDYAQIQPGVTVGGQSCNVSYAGRAPSFAGLDQINCKLPAGVTGAMVPVVVNSNGRVSSTGYIVVQ